MKLQKKIQEMFFKQIFELRAMIEAFDIDALSAYKTGAFEEITRQSASDFPTYSRALIAQILAEIHNCIIEKLQLIKKSTDSPFKLKKGQTIRNGNIRFFCRKIDLVAGKYALLFVHETTGVPQFFIADYDGEETFQIGFKANSVEESLIDIQGAYNVHLLASLTPYFRSYIAACQPNTNILEAIARGKIDSYFPQGVTQSSIFPSLNESQSQALSAFTGLGQGIQIMKGPPGTGKSTTIVSMLSVLCQRNISHAKMGPILVCGPSNKSVSVIAHSFRKKHPQIPIVLCEREDETAGLVKSLVDKEIKKAQIIFATLSKSGSAIITKSIKKIHALIIDEAGQASEPDMLIPFQLNPEKVLIVGDECQLPPTVLSKDPEKFNYHWSMLSRLIVECGQSHFLLNTQYRMHPEISFFPVEAFYSGQVNDGVTADDRAPKKGIVSYQVLDVADGNEELDPISKSYKNIQEALAVITLIADVLKAGYQVSDIAVITPYKAQLKLLKDLATNILKIENLTINTIDSFQGEESPVVFVSMVRANAIGKIGFAKDFRRLNVAITRPQQILRIVMNGATFNPLHPRNEFQNSILQVFSEFHHIPLPGNDQFPKCYEEQDYDDYSNHQTQLSDNGYRRGLEDYSRDYRFHGLIHSEVIPDQSMVDNIWNDIYKHYSKRKFYIHGSNNGIYLYRKKGSTYALVMHNDYQHEILDLSDIKGAQPYVNKLTWPERGSSNDIGNFCLIELDLKFANLIARNCKDLLFNGPEPMYRFAKLLRHAKDNIPNIIGKLPIFFLSTLPKGTHIIQDILNHMKVWDNLSFVGLSDDIFSPFKYNTLTHVSEEFEDYDYPFDDGDNYLSCGYSVCHNDYDEQEIEVENLIFKNHRFYRCDLSGVNFHNSKFINTTFDQCNLLNCKVNLDHMDEISRASFLKNAKKLHQLREQLPTDRLVLNAKQRGLYLPFFNSNKIDTISTPVALSATENTKKPDVTFQKLVHVWSRESDTESLDAVLAASKHEFLQTHGAYFNELVASYGLNLIDVPGDGNCFFHALLVQLQLRHPEILPIVLTRLEVILPRAVNHVDLRQLAVDSLLRAEESGELSAVMDDINNYIADMVMDRSWADGIVIPILARALGVTIVLINSDGNRPTFIDGGSAGTVYLGYQVGVHFQSTIGEPNLQMTQDIPMQQAVIAVERQTSAGSIDFYNKITSLSIEQMEAVLCQHPNRANACSNGEKGLSVLAVLINSFVLVKKEKIITHLANKVNTLIKYGAFWDLPNAKGETPRTLLNKIPVEIRQRLYI